MFCLLIKLFWSCDVMIYFCYINANINSDITCKTYESMKYFPKYWGKFAETCPQNCRKCVFRLPKSQNFPGEYALDSPRKMSSFMSERLFLSWPTANLSMKNLNLPLHLPVTQGRCLDNCDFGVDGLNVFIVASKKGTFKLSLKCSIKVN